MLIGKLFWASSALALSLSAQTSLILTDPPVPPAAPIAPGFTLTDTAGKSHSLSSFRGKVVVLEWTNHLCPFVVKHYQSGNMQRLQKHYAEKGVIWLTLISSAPGLQGHVTAAEADRLTRERKASPTAVLLDPQGTVGRLYQAKTTPHMYVIDPNGYLVYQGAIDSIRSTKIEDVPKAQNYVTPVLDALLAGKRVEPSSTKPYGCTVKYGKPAPAPPAPAPAPPAPEPAPDAVRRL